MNIRNTNIHNMKLVRGTTGTNWNVEIISALCLKGSGLRCLSPPPVEMVTDAVVRETPWKKPLDTSEKRLAEDIDKLGS